MKQKRCGKCAFTTESAPELARHIKSVHLNIRGKNKCPDCDFEAATMSALLYHTKTSHKRQLPKPKATYTQMICEALTVAKNRMLKQSDICAFISQKYPEYRMEDQGWQDDVRRTLSKGFKKVPGKFCPKGAFSDSAPNAIQQESGNDFNDILDQELNQSEGYNFTHDLPARHSHKDMRESKEFYKVPIKREDQAVDSSARVLDLLRQSVADVRGISRAITDETIQEEFPLFRTTNEHKGCGRLNQERKHNRSLLRTTCVKSDLVPPSPTEEDPLNQERNHNRSLLRTTCAKCDLVTPSPTALYQHVLAAHGEGAQ